MADLVQEMFNFINLFLLLLNAHPFKKYSNKKYSNNIA